MLDRCKHPAWTRMGMPTSGPFQQAAISRTLQMRIGFSTYPWLWYPHTGTELSLQNDPPYRDPHREVFIMRQPRKSDDRRSLKVRVWMLVGLGLCAVAIGCKDFCVFGDCEQEGVTAIIAAFHTTYSTCEEVTLDGTSSNNASSYQWKITKKPQESEAIITSPTSSRTALRPDKEGEYEIELTVSNADQTASDTATGAFTAVASPLADPGSYSTVPAFGTITLDGSNSKNPDADCTNDGLTYQWSVIKEYPALGVCGLSDLQPTTDPRGVALTIQAVAQYCTIRLTVTTGTGATASSEVVISSSSVIP